MLDDDDGSLSASTFESTDTHFRLCKKVAQLTKVIYHLNTRNEEREALITESARRQCAEITELEQLMENKLNEKQNEILGLRHDLEYERQARQRAATAMEMEHQKAQEELARIQNTMRVKENTLRTTYAQNYRDLGHTVETLRGDIAQLEEQSRKSRQKDEAQWNQSLENLRRTKDDEIEELVKQYNDRFKNMLAQQLSASEEQIRSLELKYSTERAALEDELLHVKTTLTQTLREKSATAEHMSKLVATNNALQVEKCEMDQVIRRGKDTIAILQQEGQRLTSSLEDAQRQVTQLRAAVEKDGASRQKMDFELNTLNVQLNDMTSQYHHEKKERIQLQSQIATLEQTVLELRSLCDATQGERSKLETERKHQTATLLQTISAYEQKMKDLEQAFAVLQQQHETEVAQRIQTEAKNSERQCADFRQQLEEVVTAHTVLLGAHVQTTKLILSDLCSELLEHQLRVFQEVLAAHTQVYDTRETQKCAEIDAWVLANRNLERQQQETQSQEEEQRHKWQQDRARDAHHLHQVSESLKEAQDGLRVQQDLNRALQDQLVHVQQKLQDTTQGSIEALKHQEQVLTNRYIAEKETLQQEHLLLRQSIEAQRDQLEKEYMHAREAWAAERLQLQAASKIEEERVRHEYMDEAARARHLLDCAVRERLADLRTELERHLQTLTLSWDQKLVCWMDGVQAKHAAELASATHRFEKEQLRLEQKHHEREQELQGCLVECERTLEQRHHEYQGTMHEWLCAEMYTQHSVVATLCNGWMQDVRTLGKTMFAALWDREVRCEEDLERHRQLHEHVRKLETQEAAEQVRRRTLMQFSEWNDKEAMRKRAQTFRVMAQVYEGWVNQLQHVAREGDEILQAWFSTLRELHAMAGNVRRAEQAVAAAHEECQCTVVRLQQEHATDRSTRERSFSDTMTQVRNEAQRTQELHHTQLETLKHSLAQYMQQVADLEERMACREIEYQKRASRPEDVKTIQKLRETLAEKESALIRTFQEMNTYKRELVNREETYNKIFGKQPVVGIPSDPSSPGFSNNVPFTPSHRSESFVVAAPGSTRHAALTGSSGMFLPTNDSMASSSPTAALGPVRKASQRVMKGVVAPV